MYTLNQNTAPIKVVLWTPNNWCLLQSLKGDHPGKVQPGIPPDSHQGRCADTAHTRNEEEEVKKIAEETGSLAS